MPSASKATGISVPPSNVVRQRRDRRARAVGRPGQSRSPSVSGRRGIGLVSVSVGRLGVERHRNGDQRGRRCPATSVAWKSIVCDPSAEPSVANVVVNEKLPSGVERDGAKAPPST